VLKGRKKTAFVEKKRIRRLRVWKKLRELESRKMCWNLLADQEIQSLEKGGGGNQSVEKEIATSRIQTMLSRVWKKAEN
jgi:hypothetical protein